MITVTIALFERLLYPDGGRDSVSGTGKHNHEPVAEVLPLASARRLDRPAQQPEVLAAQLLGNLFANLRQQCRGTDQVCEQNRHGLSSHRPPPRVEPSVPQPEPIPPAMTIEDDR